MRKWLAAVVCVMTIGSHAAAAPPKLAAQLVDAATRHAAAAITALFDTTVEYGGVWFADPACTTRFPVPGAIRGDAIATLAACLAALPLAASATTGEDGRGAVVTYDPGIELGLQFSADAAPRIRWIGYAARSDLKDGLPTITSAAFDALRGVAKHDVDLPSEVRDEITRELADAKLSEAHAWFKVCINAKGEVTGVHLRTANSAVQQDALVAAIAGWNVRPFKLGGQASPVCAVQRFTYPAPKPGAIVDDFPGAGLPPPAAVNGPTIVTAKVLEGHRIAGSPYIKPDGSTLKLIVQLDATKLVGSFKFCLDDHGTVTSVTMVESTKFVRYDRKIMHEMRSWLYSPYQLDGKAIPACAAVTFVYSAH